MKNSRQALCTDPALIHKIRPSPEELFSEPHRPYLKRVPELSNLWQKCAYGGDHDLTEVLQRQEQIKYVYTAFLFITWIFTSMFLNLFK